MGIFIKNNFRSLTAFFLSLFFGLFILGGCAQVKTYMAQREQDKALENLKKGVLEGQKYKNQLYECEITGPSGWKTYLAYPEALVIFTKDDKITRIKLEVREMAGGKDKREIKDLVVEKEKTATYQKVKEQEIIVGKNQGWAVDFEGHWREEAKGESIAEKAVYFETDKYTFTLTFYTLRALWDRNEDVFVQTLSNFSFVGGKAALTSPATPPGPATSTPPPAKYAPHSIKETETPAKPPTTPPKPPPCTPKYIGKVTAVSNNAITFNLGSEQCLRKGAGGKVYYEKIIAGAPKKIYIARIKVTSISPNTANAQIIESTDEVKSDYFIEIDKR